MYYTAVRSAAAVLVKAARGVNNKPSRALAGPLSIMSEFFSWSVTAMDCDRELFAPYVDKVSVCMHVSRVHCIMARCLPVNPEDVIRNCTRSTHLTQCVAEHVWGSTWSPAEIHQKNFSGALAVSPPFPIREDFE